MPIGASLKTTFVRRAARVRQEPVGLILPTNQPRRLRQFQGRCEEFPRDGFRNDVEDADREPQRRADRLVLHVVEELLPEREHLVRVIEGDAPRFGEPDPAADAFEQAVTEVPLELLQLVTDRRLGDVQLLGSADHPLLRDRRPRSSRGDCN